MFTGIIEETGVVERLQIKADGLRLSVIAKKTALGLKAGDSVAVNGCCLTAVKIVKRGDSSRIQFDLLDETWRLTNFQFLQPGALVNLERPLRADGRLDGHFVTGHIDGLGRIARLEKRSHDHLLQIKTSQALMRYLIYKGSIAVDGISLTVAKTGPGWFQVWIIPHTWEVTALKERRVGDAVNLETDILGKYAEKFLTSRKV